jgi:hypothetical protein
MNKGPKSNGTVMHHGEKTTESLRTVEIQLLEFQVKFFCSEDKRRQIRWRGFCLNVSASELAPVLTSEFKYYIYVLFKFVFIIKFVALFVYNLHDNSSVPLVLQKLSPYTYGYTLNHTCQQRFYEGTVLCKQMPTVQSCSKMFPYTQWVRISIQIFECRQ